MNIELSILISLLLLALVVTKLAVRRRSDVLHGAYIEDGLSKRVAAIVAL